MRWLSGVALGLSLALGLGLVLRRSSQQRQQRELAAVAAVFSGDSAAFEWLRGTRQRAVPLMEDFIQRHYRVDPVQIEQDAAGLRAPDGPGRRVALARLTLLPERALGLLKRQCEQASAPEHKECLRQIIAGRARGQKQVAGFLAGLYAEHFSELFVARRVRLEQNCRDAAAELFFAYAPFQQTWARLRDSPADLQVRFLLLRLYTGREEQAVQNLERFPAPDILRVAGQTWWPVEIEPPAHDGAYRWSTRAATAEGNIATHLLRLSMRPPDQAGGPEPWLHLDRWFRWTYLFRYQPPVSGADAMVYAEDEVRSQNQSWRRNLEASRDPGESGLWLPGPSGTNLIGAGKCEAVRGVPASALLPRVRLSREEEQKNHGRVLCEWARPLVPEPIQSQVHFSANQFPPPQVLTGADAPTDRTKPRPKRKR